MREWLKRHATEIKQVATGIIAFTGLASLVVAYATPLQDWMTGYPGAAAAFGGVIICAMAAAAYINLPRYVFLVALPLVLVCAVVWVMLTVKTLKHFDFYTANIARSLSRIPEPLPEQLSALPSTERKQFELAPRRLKRASGKLRHHLDRHAFWSKALLALVACAITIGFLPKTIKTRPDA